MEERTTERTRNMEIRREKSVELYEKGENKRTRKKKRKWKENYR